MRRSPALRRAMETNLATTGSSIPQKVVIPGAKMSRVHDLEVPIQSPADHPSTHKRGSHRDRIKVHNVLSPEDRSSRSTVSHLGESQKSTVSAHSRRGYNQSPKLVILRFAEQSISNDQFNPVRQTEPGMINQISAVGVTIVRTKARD